MTGTLLMIAIVPAILYLVIAYYGDDNAGIWGAMISCSVLVLLLGVATGDWDETVLLELVLVNSLGAMALKFKNPLYFKLQPAITAVALAAFLGYYEAQGESYLAISLAKMAHLDPRLNQTLADPRFGTLLTVLPFHLIALFLIHGALVVIAALKLKNLGWVIAKLAIYPMLLCMIIIDFIVYFTNSPPPLPYGW